MMTDIEQKDKDHIKILSIFHYVICGFSLFGILFLVLHYMIFHTVLTNDEMLNESSDAESLKGFFAIFVWVYLLMGLFILIFAVMNFLSARFMTQRKNRLFSLITAGMNCIQFPFGTTLGVFTIIVLLRDSVVQTYKEHTQ